MILSVKRVVDQVILIAFPVPLGNFFFVVPASTKHQTVIISTTAADNWKSVLMVVRNVNPVLFALNAKRDNFSMKWELAVQVVQVAFSLTNLMMFVTLAVAIALIVTLPVIAFNASQGSLLSI